MQNCNWKIVLTVMIGAYLKLLLSCLAGDGCKCLVFQWNSCQFLVASLKASFEAGIQVVCLNGKVCTYRQLGKVQLILFTFCSRFCLL